MIKYNIIKNDFQSILNQEEQITRIFSNLDKNPLVNLIYFRIYAGYGYLYKIKNIEQNYHVRFQQSINLFNLDQTNEEKDCFVYCYCHI